MTISMSKRWPIVYLVHFNFKFDDLATKSKTVEFPNSCEGRYFDWSAKLFQAHSVNYV